MHEAGSSTKGRLARRRRELALYEQVLPSLELKRQLLVAERYRQVRGLEAWRVALEALQREAGERLPMVANAEVPLSGLARVEGVETAQTRILGIAVPSLVDLRWAPPAYSLLATPHWVDDAVDTVRRAARQRLEITFAEERVRRIDRAIRKVVQRVNLFQKVLIPGARAEIQRLRIALADAERSAVVRSKIFKARQQSAAGVRR